MPRNRTSRIRTASIGVVVVAASVRSFAAWRYYVDTEGIARSVAQMAGIGLGILFCSWIVGHLLRKRVSGAMWPLFGLSFAAWCAYSSGRMLREAATVEEKRGRIVTAVEQHLQTPTAPPAEGTQDRAVQGDELDGVSAVLDWILREKSAQNAVLFEAIATLDSKRILTETVFGDTDTMKHAMSRIDTFLDVLPGILDSNERMLSEALQSFKEIDLTQGSESAAGFRETSQETREHNKRFVGLWVDYARSVRELVEFLIERQDRYVVDEGQIYFHVDADLDAFRALAGRVDTLATSIDEASDSQRERMRLELEEFKNIGK